MDWLFHRISLDTQKTNQLCCTNNPTFWHTRSHAVILYDSVPTDYIEVMSTKLDVILNQRIPTPRSPHQVVLKEAWRLQRDEESQRRRGIENSIAEEERSKIDSIVQGVPHKAVLGKTEDSKIGADSEKSIQNEFVDCRSAKD